MLAHTKVPYHPYLSVQSFIAVFLLVSLHELDCHHQHAILGYRTFDHTLDPAKAVLDLFSVSLKMTDIFSEALGHNVDPKAPLSNIDLAKLLMNDSTTKVKELRDNLKEVLDSDREHNKKIVETVITGICKRLNSLEELVLKNKTGHSKALSNPLSPPDHAATFTFLSNSQHSSRAESPPSISCRGLPCNVCNRMFYTLSELDVHIEADHKSLICQYCGKTLRSRPDYNYHKHKYHSKIENLDPSRSETLSLCNDQPHQIPQVLSCTKCGCELNCIEALRNHRTSCHGPTSTPVTDQSFTCFYPDQASPQEQDSEVEVLKVHDIPQHSTSSVHCCFKCGKGFISHEYLSFHVKSSHSETSWFPCNICKHFFSSSAELSLHIETFHGSPLMIHCKFCDATFTNMRNLNKHTACMHRNLDDVTMDFHVLPSYHCNDCEHDFYNSEQLNIHVRDHHKPPTPISNDHSGPALQHALPYDEHNGLARVHEQIDRQPQVDGQAILKPLIEPSSEPVIINTGCYKCDKIFTSYSDLQNHVTTEHADLLFPDRFQFPLQTQAVDNMLETHPSNLTDTILPQTDGAHDDSAINDVSLIPVQNSQSVSSLVAQYCLNQQRQLSGLYKHSFVNDFEIVTNDSGRNINIQCSTGFYEAVAKPSLSCLSTGFQTQVESILIECTESRNLVDLAANLPGLLLKFKAYGNGVFPTPASLSVHLHHTQQKVQVQGGAKMPSNITAAAWFVDKVLRERFIAEARDKRFDIENINKIVSNLSSTTPLSPSMPSPIPSYCPHCRKKFSSSSRPVTCPKCSLFRHKAKCAPCPSSPLCPPPSALVDASAVVSIPSVCTSTSNGLPFSSSPVSTGSADSSHASQLLEGASQPLTKRLRYTVSNSVPQITTVSVADSVPTSIISMSTNITSFLTTFTAVTTSSAPTTLQSSSSSAVFSTDIPSSATTVSTNMLSAPIISTHAQGSSTGVSVTRKRKSNQTNSSRSAEQAEIDFLKLELNAVRTQVIELESTKADLERKNKIMNDVIKMHEQRQASQAYAGISNNFSHPK